MCALPMEVRWEAVVRLQRIQLHSRSITPFIDDVEHATTLVLSDRRTNPNAKFLAHDAVRDARRRRPRQIVPFSALDATRDHRTKYQLEYDAAWHGCQVDDPMNIAIASDLEAFIRRALSSTPGAASCLDGMLAGETEHETAVRLGLPRHRIIRLRATIRNVSRRIIDLKESVGVAA